MKTLHVKSPCCQGKTIRFGNRRRQCTLCKKTWTVRQKKRGKKRKRISKSILIKTLIDGQSLKFQLRRNYSSLPALYKRFRYTLRLIYKQPRRYSLPQGKLVLIGDGLWFNLDKQDWVLYVLAVKSIKDNWATILDPVLIVGNENYEKWKEVINRVVPKSAKKCILAFVSDNFRGSTRLCNELGWIHQLCHFHLLSRLQVVRGRKKINLPHRNIRERVYQDIRLILETQDEKQLKFTKQRLKRWSHHPDCPQKVGSISREFLKEVNCYRAYLNYPELNLPTTTNSIESLNKKICRITRHLNTPNSVKLWSTAFIRLLKVITCNGKKKQQN